MFVKILWLIIFVDFFIKYFDVILFLEWLEFLLWLKMFIKLIWIKLLICKKIVRNFILVCINLYDLFFYWFKYVCEKSLGFLVVCNLINVYGVYKLLRGYYCK